MAAFNKFNPFVEALCEKVHNLGSDTLCIALSNTAPNATNATLSAISQISYTTFVGGVGTGRDIVASSSAQTGGTYKLIIADKVLTASAQTASFRYVIIYNKTATAKNLIGWYDYSSSIRLNTNETFTIDFDGTNGVLTLA